MENPARPLAATKIPLPFREGLGEDFEIGYPVRPLPPLSMKDGPPHAWGAGFSAENLRSERKV